ncbi:hypothetical protein EVAR_46762_1 [Eumeta japonica]|uniref:DUF5641 domain-containing protein n=1 Tax=Eumeta variegata TaxID=151549 RepID=A0A4C2ACH5_EUMVA|nr:hypothetical protein EVAR_46762_1 [Eumeta japonica]
MEVASSLSADSMIMALRRFMARRGQPDTLYSDHGTNFVGAAAELSRARLEIEERMSDEATTRAIRWLRIPPTPRIWAEAGNACRDISTPLKNVPENSGERVRRSQRCSGRDGCENTSPRCRDVTSGQGEATDQSRRRGRHHRPRLPRNTWPRGIVERVYPGIDGQVRVVDIRTAHGRLRRPTARLAVLPTEVESSHAPTGVDC